jgi:uncharacterized membrane protein (UPF0127 family)
MKRRSTSVEYRPLFHSTRAAGAGILAWLRADIFLALLLGALALSCAAQPATDQTLPLYAGIHRIEAEVAATPERREVGLMHRELMPMQHGMLFVFPNVARHCMWMKNTPLPLSVAFLDEQGRIINIEEMLPLSEESHCAAKPAKYALEMNQGWFAARGLMAGTGLTGIEQSPKGY